MKENKHFTMDSRDWFIDHREVTLDERHILGEGFCSLIYKGKWRCLDVAVKKFDIECQPINRSVMKKELDVLIRIHHPHILQILGVCWNPLMLILEYMPKGNLRQNIQSFSRQPWFITCFQKKKWSLQICLGLVYLHERKPEYVIHRDLKPSNILVDHYRNVKIADFGLSKLIETNMLKPVSSLGDGLNHLGDEKLTHTIGTPFFAAPEVFVAQKGHYDTSADIWSLGCTLYEIWEGIPISSQCDIDTLYNGQWTPVFHYCPRKLRPYISSCLSVDAQKRPDIRTLMSVFKSLTMCDLIFKV